MVKRNEPTVFPLGFLSVIVTDTRSFDLTLFTGHSVFFFVVSLSYLGANVKLVPQSKTVLLKISPSFSFVTLFDAMQSELLAALLSKLQI